MMRILLFIATNLAVLLLINILIHLFGLEPYLYSRGIALGPLFVIGAIVGFTGAIFSLLISKWMAKNTMGVEVIVHPATEQQQWLVTTVERLSLAAGIGKPEVGIFEAEDPNAFATGAFRDSALVAVSTGLLERMNRQQVEAVLGHEVSHIANGDMVTMTLLQGVLNTFVFVLSHVVGRFVDRVILKDEDGRGMGQWIATMVAQIFLGILASMIVMWFSRRREFRADAGGAHLAGRQSMISALQALQAVQSEGLPEGMQAMGIAGNGGMSRLFMSHPPLEERIAALRNATA
jgi:heat shock protein HtpX